MMGEGRIQEHRADILYVLAPQGKAEMTCAFRTLTRALARGRRGGGGGGYAAAAGSLSPFLPPCSPWLTPTALREAKRRSLSEKRSAYQNIVFDKKPSESQFEPGHTQMLLLD